MFKSITSLSGYRRDLQRHPGKAEDHYSNLYHDGHMPHMHRITWSGIALHGGVLPGRPASHGCIRLPFDFAERLFGATAIGMRVIVAPTDVAPVEVAHPLLFQPKPGAGALAASRIAEAQAAARKATEAQLAAGTASQGGQAGHGADSCGGKSEAQSRGAIGGCRDQPWRSHLGGGKGAG